METMHWRLVRMTAKNIAKSVDGRAGVPWRSYVPAAETMVDDILDALREPDEATQRAGALAALQSAHAHLNDPYEFGSLLDAERLVPDPNTVLREFAMSPFSAMIASIKKGGA